MAPGDVDPSAAAAGRMRPLQRWLARLETPIDGASLGVFRIVFGLAMAIDAWRYLAYGWVDVLYVQPMTHFHYFGFGWVQPWPGIGMRLHFWAISVLALCVAAGLLYRAASILLFVAYLYVFLLDQAAYMNHHYLMLLVAFLLAVMPAANALSLRRLRTVEAAAPQAPSSVPVWTVWVLRFQLAVVYYYAAIAKLDPDWLQGQPMRSTLEQMAVGYPPVFAAVGAPLVAYGVAYLGLIADLAIPSCLLFRRTRTLGLCLAVVFHGANAVALDIGVFSYLMLAMLPIFLDPDWPRRLLGVAPVASIGSTATPRWLFVVLHLFIAVQLIVPLRHWLYPGPVRWTEEGHRFSWRMMLRTKRSQLALRVTDPTAQRSWTINPANDLSSVQLRELETYPDLVLQYVHFHRDRLRREGVADAAIHVDWMCSLNGRRPRPLADPDVDLAGVERSLAPASWILPLD